jgi:PAS domain-containing protein
MKKKDTRNVVPAVGANFFESSWEQSWTYIKTVVDVVREPMLILDKDFNVLAANEPFYKTFRVGPDETVGRFLYNLGNGQWKIPELQRFLSDILPKQTFFKGFEVAHDFPLIGRKVMIMNGRQLHFAHDANFPAIILLAMEDVTEMIAVAERMAGHVNKFEVNIAAQTDKMAADIKKLQKEIRALKGK